MLSGAMLLRSSDGDPGFTDVATSDYFWLAAAVQAGLVTGHDDGTFAPMPLLPGRDGGHDRALRAGQPLKRQPNGCSFGLAGAEDVSAWALSDIAVASRWASSGESETTCWHPKQTPPVLRQQRWWRDSGTDSKGIRRHRAHHGLRLPAGVYEHPSTWVRPTRPTARCRSPDRL